MSTPFDYYGGVDFSGAKEPLSNLWSAIGREEDGRLKILSVRPHAFRADLANYVADGWHGSSATGRRRILWGVDFPFGLPSSVSRAMGAGGDWGTIVEWVADRPADEVRSAAGDVARALRAGDMPGALPPLDLRLYKQTVEGLRWIQHLREEASVSVPPQAPDDAAPVTLIEVYPSGTAQELGLPRRRVPSRAGEARARAAALRTFLDFDSPDCEAVVVNLEDAWDAAIACLTAYLCRENLDQPSESGADTESIAREGWIYRPPAIQASLAPRRG